MIKIGLLTLSGWLILSIAGCGELKKRVFIDVEQPLFANVIKDGETFKVKEIHDLSGDVNLKTLQLTSDAVAIKLCGAKDNLGCIDTILDAVDQKVQRKSVLATYDHVIQLQNKHKQALESIYTKFEESYRSDVKKVRLAYLINDETRFYKGSKIPFKELVYVTVNELKYPDEALHKKELHDMFPHPLEDFQTNINLLQKDLAYNYEKDIKVYNRNISYRSSFYPMVVAKNKAKVGAFTIKIQAPKEVKRGSRDKIRVIFHIVGKDFKEVYPYKFEIKNRDLKLVLDKRHTTFTNLSDKNINLESISLFYNGYNHATLLGDNFSFSSISKKASTSTPSKIFFTEHFNKAAFFPEITKEKALITQVDFGITLKYKIDGKSKEEVLSGSKKERLWHSITGW